MRYDHAVIPVADAEKALAFYGKVLRLPLAQTIEGPDWGGFPWLMMIFAVADAKELVVVAFKGWVRDAGPPAPDMRHYAFSAESAEDLEAWRARLEAAGADYWRESHGDRVSYYFPDPEGTILEITWPPADVTIDPGAVEAAKRWIAANR